MFEESAQPFPTNDHLGGRVRERSGVHGCERLVAHTLMRPFAARRAVVMSQVLVQQVAQMALAELVAREGVEPRLFACRPEKYRYALESVQQVGL